MAKKAKTAKAPKAPKSTAAKADPSTTGPKDTAVGGKTTHPANKRVPDSVLIKRPNAAEAGGTKVTKSAEVQGDQSLQIIDIVNNRAVQVVLFEGKALTKDADGRLVFIQGPVSNNLVPLATARGLFAVKKDGTVIYNDRGFDDVASADFDLLDIEKLIAHNNK